jgi:hypothetical protein
MAITDTSGTSEIEQLRQQLAERDREKAELLIEIGRLHGEAAQSLQQQTATAEVLVTLIVWSGPDR